MTAGSVILEDDGNGVFTERHVAKTPSQLNAGGDISAAWPIGSIFVSAVATDPSTLLGFGTWSAIGAGRVLIGQDAGDTDFDTLGETGGSKAVQSSAQTFAGDTNTTSQANTGATKIGSTTSTATLKAHTHTVVPTGTNTPGAATSVVQPYLVVKFWQRTA